MDPCDEWTLVSMLARTQTSIIKYSNINWLLYKGNIARRALGVVVQGLALGVPKG